MNTAPFPDELVEAQTAWYVTYRQLADASSAHGTAGRRRRLQELSRRIAGHPYWQTPAGTPAARMALKEIAQTAAKL
ncbi:hypothetical protein OH797_39035 (plasmid) [Streptomyces anulatus]|uniref:hypothetical protein n=1 Tax=Streptomyces anulatus TaxID=1892 RepID=UPI002F9114FE